MTWYALAMFISDKSDLEKLNFSPRSHIFKMARVEWKNVVLNPSEHEDSPIVDLSEWNLGDCLHDLFGSLSLVEIFELFRACDEWPDLKKALDKAEFMNRQGRQWNQRLMDLFACLQKLPESFLQWAHSKQMGTRELQPLLALKDLKSIIPFLEQFTEQNLSRNDGKQIIDLLVDLILLEKQQEALSPQPGQVWTQQLQKLRNPMAEGQNPNSLHLAWPKYVQVVNFRQGDRVLKKMQITFMDKEDLNDKLQRLSKQEFSK